MIENVQVRATKLDALRGLIYTERLKKLHLQTLVYRTRGGMIEIFKQFHSYDETAFEFVQTT